MDDWLRVLVEWKLAFAVVLPLLFVVSALLLRPAFAVGVAIALAVTFGVLYLFATYATEVL